MTMKLTRKEYSKHYITVSTMYGISIVWWSFVYPSENRFRLIDRLYDHTKKNLDPLCI